MESNSGSLQQAVTLLIRYLEQQESEGRRKIWISPRARKDLRMMADLDWSHTETASAEEGGSIPPAQEAASQPTPTARVREETPALDEPKGVKGPEPGEKGIRPEGETAEEQLAYLRRLAANWEPARTLDSLREKMVFAVGNPEADLMLVGEAPGGEEERRGEPFVGPAGQKLNQILKAMGLERSEVYISNIVKFRPALPNQGESNRKPTAEEMASCIDFVLAEISVVKPKVLVALGGTAAEGLLGSTEGVGRLRHRFHELEGVPVMVTYHPSYLLRNVALAEKRKVWEDMLMVMERLKLPISEKQRGFFKA